MSKTVSTNKPEVLSETAKNIFAGIIAVFIVTILSVFPLYYDNYYFNILKAKYSFYYISVLVLLGVCLLVALIICFVDFKEYGGYSTKRFFKGLVPKNLWTTLTFMDKALIVFLAATVIATLQSDYIYESFWGNEGRFSGLFLISMYVGVTFLVAKLAKIKKWYFDLFLFAGVLVCLYGITDYFKMDIFGWTAGVQSTQKDSFVSTIGNINTYTVYVALVMGVAVGLFCSEKNIFRRVYYYAVIIVSFFAIIMGQSDNAYLSLGVMFGLLPLALFGTRKGIKQYAVIAATFMSVIKCVSVINIKMAGSVISLTGIFKSLTEHGSLTYIVIALWVLVIVLYIGDRHLFAGKDGEVGKWPRIIWLVLIAAAVAVILWILYDANFAGHADKYQAFSQYVVFNDNWGTNRGYCWRIGWESYMKQPLHHKLFGFGPDTYGILTWAFREESLSLHGVIYENAHNEYLQYLCTVGVFGVVSYLAFLGSAITMLVKKQSKNPWILAPLLAVLCYCVQAVVNINLPIATPIMWLLLAMGVAMGRNEKQEEKIKK